MKRSFLDSVLRGAEALAARDPVGTLPDPDLLRRFAGGRDPTAFAVLVRRHGPLVWGVCRHLLPADADAEDAFQATFLALIRSAGSIRRTEALGGWLHGVAYRVALKARRAAARRKKREVTAAVPEPSSPVPDAAWDELQAAVHEEVCRLPDKLRLPFVLCGLQGRPQKEAAEVLGWKVGTVSGRLSEARRVLLDRLARRGVPAAVGLGATVLGGVAGQAAVPTLLRLKVLSVAGSPATVSPTVLSLARGATPMYLTRSKLLAAGLVLVGILTTSAGVLSKADAQPQPGNPYDDAVRRYQDALRVRLVPQNKWEYKFIPVDKPLTTADLQKVLAGADQEGWAYCGSQELAQDKTGKVTPHMVFKRPAASGMAAESTPGARDAAAAALADLKARNAASAGASPGRIAEYEQLFRKQVEAERALAEAAAREAGRLRLLADDKAAADRAARDEAARNTEAEAKVRTELEKAIRAAAAQADAARADEKALLDQARRKELEAMKAQYEKLIDQLQVELKAKGALPPAKGANPFDKKPEPRAGNDPFNAGGDTPVTVTVKLAHVDGKTAAAELARRMPTAKIVAEVSPNTITLTGPAAVLTTAREYVKVSDVPATQSTAELAVVRLKHMNAADVVKVLEKSHGSTAARFTADAASNVVVISAPPGVMANLKKLVAEADKPAGPAK